MTPYQHGGQVYQFARDQQQPTLNSLQSVLDFSASINPVKPSIDWSSLAHHAQITVGHYPDAEHIALKQAVAKRFHLTSEYVTLTNGISSAIMSLFANIKPDTSLLFTPIYGEYQRAAKLYSNQVIESFQALSKRGEISDATYQIIQSLSENSVSVLVNPSTPEGLYLSPHVLKPLLNALKSANGWVLIDESFLPFISFNDCDSVRGQLDDWPKLIILQSLTKYYACPGVRIGALFSAKNTLKHWAWPSWPLSILDEHYLLQALDDTEHEAATTAFLTHEKPNFINALNKCSIIQKVHTSSANFLLIETHATACDLVERLQKNKILIRDCESFGLGKHTCRIAIKSAKDNQVLIKALQQCTPLQTLQSAIPLANPGLA